MFSVAHIVRINKRSYSIYREVWKRQSKCSVSAFSNDSMINDTLSQNFSRANRNSSCTRTKRRVASRKNSSRDLSMARKQSIENSYRFSSGPLVLLSSLYGRERLKTRGSLRSSWKTRRDEGSLATRSRCLVNSSAIVVNWSVRSSTSDLHHWTANFSAFIYKQWRKTSQNRELG